MPFPNQYLPQKVITILISISIDCGNLWQPTPVLLPGKSHGWRSLVGCSPWGREELGMTERLHFHFSLSCIGEGNGNPLQCSCLENPRDGGAWRAAIYGVAQSRTQLKRLSSSSSMQNLCSLLLKLCRIKSYKMYSSVWLLSGLHLWDLPISLHLSVFCFPLYQSHCMGKLFIHSCWWTFGLFPSFGYYEKTFYEYSRASFLADLSRCIDLLKWNCQVTENVNVQL